MIMDTQMDTKMVIYSPEYAELVIYNNKTNKLKVMWSFEWVFKGRYMNGEEEVIGEL